MRASGERADPAEQWGALQALVQNARSGNLFYRQKWASLGEPQSLEDFFARYPFTTKAELVANQASSPPYGDVRSLPLSRFTRLHQTSGTTGEPLRWLDTPDSWSAMVDDWARVLAAAGVSPADRVFFAFSFGPFIGFWLAFEAAQRLGCLAIPGGGMGSPLRLRVILENQATVVCCTPTYALHLAETARTEGLDLGKSKVRLLMVAGEPGGSDPGVRSRIAAAWGGARVFDHHGMTETGPVTYEDPSHPGRLLILERSFLAESVKPESGLPAALGEPGELVLTTLRRTACPLFRYRTGDLVRLDRAAPRAPLGLDGGVLGRVDDMLVIRGVNVYPAAIDRWVRSFPEIGEYRVTVDERSAMPELFIEVEAPAGVEDALARRLRDHLGIRIPVAWAAEASLPRFELKARRWRRLRPGA